MADEIRNQYTPNKSKSYKAQLIYMLETDFAFIGCNKTLELVADSINELNNQFYPRTEYIHPGKVIVSAIDKNESSGHHRGTKKLKQVSVQLDILNDKLIKEYEEGKALRAIKIDYAASLFMQAYEQGGVLSCSDVALIMKMSSSSISKYTKEYMLKNGVPLPTRGFVHDLGPSITHKEIIVGKFLEGKISNKIAKDTNHSQEAVDRYIRDYERIKICLKKDMSDDQISTATKLSLKLVAAYRNLYKKYEVDIHDNKNE